jgi:DNA-binding transcriptional MocR family regulator
VEQANSLQERLEAARRDYDDLVTQHLSLDLTRGKPAADQLDLAGPLLSMPGDHYLLPDGTDSRNYGGGLGSLALRQMFSGPLQVPVGQLFAAGNSSLELMHDCLVHALLSVLPGAARRWADEERIAFLCPVPGYDRHFALCERFGIDMIPVPLTGGGPDMDAVEELVRTDTSIRGIWCVPKYSNPTGETYSAETVSRLAAMTTAAPDFRIFWDNAYAVHHLTDDSVEIPDLLALAAEAGHADRVFVFGSTSKITFAGAGVAFFGASAANVSWLLDQSAKRTIGPDKINHLRHAQFLQNEAGLHAHMAEHRKLLRPKFDTVQRILNDQLAGTGLAEWTSPRGGYFVTMEVADGCARAIVQAAAKAGIVLTPAGATHPYGDDPRDSVIRIAPTYLTLADLERAMSGLATCTRLVGYEALWSRPGGPDEFTGGTQA